MKIEIPSSCLSNWFIIWCYMG